MAISEDVTEHLRREKELSELTARLMNLQDEERRRIARELHDGTAQNLFAISINVGQLQRNHQELPTDAKRIISECQSLAEESLQELRTLSYVLHPPLLDQAGLVPALQWYVEGFTKRSQTYVDLVVLDDIGRLSPEVETALFRVVQESLTNIWRHSGSDTATIRLEKRPEEILLQIKDRGHGIKLNPDSGNGEKIQGLGVGIPGMRQRLRQLGGTLDVVSNGDGTRIVATVPFAEESSHGASAAG